MKYNVIAYKNNALGCFCNPVYEDHDLDTVRSIASRSIRAMLLSDVNKAVSTYSNLHLMHIGYFDDESGVLESIEPIVLLDCDAIIKDSTESKDAN